MTTQAAVLVTSDKMTREQRKVAYATIIGTTVEWYDFFIYAAAAGLVFKDLFFLFLSISPLKNSSCLASNASTSALF